MNLSAKDIASRLAGRAESFVPWLLPNGKRESGNWLVGGTNGESGKSMRVQIAGGKAGIWKDFASDNEKGDLLDLICAVKSITFREALRFAKDYLGVFEPESVVPKKAWGIPRKINRSKPSGEVLKYLTGERRLKEETLYAYHIVQATNVSAEIVFPCYAPGKDGGLVNCKFLAVKRDEKGKKITRQEGGCAPALFGWQVIEDGAREVLISEGEVDAMTWYQEGFPALSVPMGSGNDQWIDYEWDNLEQFDSIYLCYDETKDGQEGAKRVAKRLGVHRCLMVRLKDHKDPNEALQQGKPRSYFSSAVASAKPLSPASIKSPGQFREKVHNRFYPKDNVEPGYFPPLFHKRLGLRPGELTLWTGIAGHGKSILLNQISIGAMLAGNKVAIGSMEMKGEQTLQKMICQSENTVLPLPHVIDAVLDWLCNKLWVYDLMGSVGAALVLELMQYSFARHGVNFYVIDSLMKCGINSEDYEAQRSFLNDLSSFAKETNSHVNLVAHARKGRDEGNAPGKLDVKGSSDIINQADNILVTWRNKEKEELRHDGVITETQEQGMPDAIVWCNKQRESGEEFKQRLGFKKGPSRFFRMGDDWVENLSIISQIKWESNQPLEMNI